MVSPVTSPMASPPFFSVLFLLLLLTSFFPGGAPDLAADGAALLALRAAVGRTVLPWNASESPCFWHGVTCKSSSRVIALRLPGVGLIGSIPAATVGNLSALRILSLRYNGLSGSLPPDISSLTELRNLYLHQNRFSGAIPSGLGSLGKLVRLDLAGNQFSGAIPPELTNLTRLRVLNLESNQLSGEIPSFDLPDLRQFNVSFNQVNGSIPPKLRTFPANSFLSTGLCGRPLQACPGEIAPSPAADGPTAQGPAGENPSREDGNGKKKLSGGAIAGIAIGSVVVVLILLVLLILLCRKNGKSKTSSLDAVEARGKQPEAAVAAAARDKGLGEGGSGMSATPPTAPSVASAGAKKLVFFGGSGATLFDLEDLLRASAEVLGKGTFGTAYKAVLEIGTTVAVKRLKDVTLTEREFREKVELIGAMNHPNIVPLRAYYFSKDEKLLVYDYMSLGSLSAVLHGNKGSGRTPLSWETRTGIALAAARGIEYIHSNGPSYSHGNIKSSNILLAKSYEARISDHGLALLAGPASSSTRVAGYRAPEVTDPRRVSQKADVYSFGVLLLELLTGKAPAQAYLNEEGIDLPRWVQSVVREEWTAEVFDPELLRYQNVEEDMVRLLQLAIDCTAHFPDKRLSMPEVVAQIEEVRSSALKALNQDQQSDSTGIVEEGDGHSSRRTGSITQS
ncbi:putative inactive receptor kinase [Canna indica]|uniref:Inactive receptor kinase n=1 Tax=Canna indica TaxID=4628 RepID=A0AAQ3Q3V1_9LILI|nr:putative inactive receptor kinase [Canna indica]